MKISEVFDLLKEILMKYLIPTLLSVIFACLGVAYVPKDFNLYEQLGKTWFAILVFCISFVIIELIKKLYRDFTKRKAARENKIKREKSQTEQRKNMIETQLENLWSFVDEIPSEDYKQLVKFVENGNQPYTTSAQFFGLSLFNSNFVHETVVKDETKKTINPNREKHANAIFIPAEMMIPAKKQYVLKDDVYKLLVYSKEKYGRICHFNK